MNFSTYSQFYFNSNDNNDSMEPCSELENQLKNVPIDLKGELIFNFFYVNRAKYSDFLSNITKDIIIEATQKNCDDTLAWSYLVLGWLKNYQNLYSESLQLFIESQKKFIKSSNKEGLSRALNGEAVSLKDSGRYSEALKIYLDAFEIAKEAENNNLLSAISSNIGTILLELKLYDEALEYFQQALAMEKSPSINRAIQLSNTATTYRYLRNVELAEKYILDALKFNELEKFHNLKADFLLELGILKKTQNKISEAKDYFTETLGFANKLNAPRLKATTLLQLAIIEKEADNYNESLNLLLTALDLFEEIQAKDYEAQTLLVLSEVHGALGNFIDAYDSSKKAQELKIKLFNDEIANRMSAMKIQQARRENLIYKDLYHRINIISQIGQAITSTFDIIEIGNMVYKHLKDLLEIDSLAIGLYSEDQKYIFYKIYIKEGKFRPEIVSPLNTDCLIKAQCIFNQKGIVINDVADDSNYPCPQKICGSIPLDDDINSFICTPMVIKDKPLGLITVQSTKKDVYSPHHVDVLMAFAAYIAIALDNEQLFSNVNELATVDSLTGLLNRRSIFERADSEYSRHKRYHTPLSIIMLDIDKFKSINDTYGHATGDMVLRDVAAIFNNVIRNNDILGRLGGDEFLLILPNTSIDDGVLLAERLLSNVFEKEYNFEGDKRNIRISLGVAELVPEDNDISEAINRADKALYSAKQTGGNKVVKAT